MAEDLSRQSALWVISALNSVNSELAPPLLGVPSKFWEGYEKVRHWVGQLTLPTGLGTCCMYTLVLGALSSSLLWLGCTLYSRTPEKMLLHLCPIGLQGVYMGPPQAHLPWWPMLSSLLSYATSEQETPGCLPQLRAPREQNAQTNLAVLWHSASKMRSKAASRYRPPSLLLCYPPPHLPFLSPDKMCFRAEHIGSYVLMIKHFPQVCCYGRNIGFPYSGARHEDTKALSDNLLHLLGVWKSISNLKSWKMTLCCVLPFLKL